MRFGAGIGVALVGDICDIASVLVTPHRSLRSLLPIALVIAATLGATRPGAAAEPEGYFGPPRYARGWMHVRTGLTFSDTLVIDDGSLGLESNGDPGFVLGLGAHWRTSRIDLGLLFESTTSYAFTGLERANRVGAQFRVAADLRWRYIEDHWGALFLRLTPGISALSHADPLRFQVAELMGGDLAGVDQHNVGFSLGFDFGVLVYLDERLAVSIDLDVVSAMTSIDTDQGEVDLDMVRGIFGVGLEWRL